MKTFRPAAASISLGCREFNLCVFVGAEILFFSVCFFSSFYTSSPVWFCLCHFLDLPFWSSLLSVSGSSSFSCLLASWCLLRKMSVPKRMRKQHGSEASAIFRKRRPEVVHVFFFVLFSLVPMDPPQLDSDNFFFDLGSASKIQGKSRGNPWKILGGSQQIEGKSRGESSENPRGQPAK